VFSRNGGKEIWTKHNFDEFFVSVLKALDMLLGKKIV
jgi:hypothetical protein